MDNGWHRLVTSAQEPLQGHCSSAAKADPQFVTAYLGDELLCLPCLLPIAQLLQRTA